VDNFADSQAYPQSPSLRYETFDDISHQAQVEKHSPRKQNDSSRNVLIIRIGAPGVNGSKQASKLVGVALAEHDNSTN